MAACTQPLFVNQPAIFFSNVIVQNNATRNLTTGFIGDPVFSANSSGIGGYLDHIRVKPLGNANSVIVRVFLNNGLDRTVSNNNIFISESMFPNTFIQVPLSYGELYIPVRMGIPSGWNVYVTLGTNISNSSPNGYFAMGIGGQFIPPATTPMMLGTPKIYSSNTITIGSNTFNLVANMIGPIPPPVYRSNTTNGSFFDYMRCKPLGTNVQTSVRIFLNNGQDPNLANNNGLFTDISLPAITLSETLAQNDIVVSVRTGLPPGWNVYTTLASNVAAGWIFTGVGGDY